MHGQAVEVPRKRGAFVEAFLIDPLEMRDVGEIGVLTFLQFPGKEGSEFVAHVIQIAGPGWMDTMIGSRQFG